jgi:hypothetical protein
VITLHSNNNFEEIRSELTLEHLPLQNKTSSSSSYKVAKIGGAVSLIRYGYESYKYDWEECSEESCGKIGKSHMEKLASVMWKSREESY